MSDIIDTAASPRAPLALLPILLATAIVAGACVGLDDAEDALLIRAPRGLETALETALQGFEGTLSGNPPTVLYGPTEGHARRVTEESAATDILFTDHPAWADYVVQRTGVVDRQVLARDALVVVVAPTRADAVGELAALADPSFERISVPSTESTPAGMYAREALLRYGLWSGLADRIDRADDAAQAVARVLDARADAAIVLASDARAAGVAPDLRIDPAYHQPARVEVLLLRDEPRARALFDFLAGPQTASAFQAQGFEAPGTPTTGGP